MTDNTQTPIEFGDISDEVLRELTNRVQDIDNAYRSVAEKMGQLYMCADENKVKALIDVLDKPMRNASDNEQTFAAILKDLKMHANQQT